MSNHGVIDGIEETLCAPVDQVLQVVKLRVRVEPPSGAVLIYGGPVHDDPVLVSGPEQIVELATKTHTVIVQKIRGAESYEIETLGYLAQRPLDV